MRVARRLPGRLVSIVLLLLWLAAAAAAGPLKLGRERLKEYWGEPRKPSAAATEKIGDALKRAQVPTDSPAWMALANEYSRLDHLAQAEPAVYEGADKDVKAAWFTHGIPHLLDILHLAVNNETFVKDVWATQGLTGDAAEQSYRDLILAIVGHDSQQVGFASPDPKVREATRVNHALKGGTETARAFGAAPGENPAGVVRQLVLGLAAAGHSKSAVNLKDPVQMATVVNAIAKDLGVTVTNDQVQQIIKQASPIAGMLGALDALRDRGPGGLGHTTAPCGENVIYRIRTDGGPAIEVYNTKTEKVLKTFEGRDHRTYIEANTKLELVQLEDKKVVVTLDFADVDIADAGRLNQANDIGLDLARTGLPTEITYKKADGSWGKATYNP